MTKKKEQVTKDRAIEDAKAVDTAPENQEIVRANVNREIVEAPGFVSLYANDTQVQVSPWDIRLIFGVISEPATADRRTVIVKTIGEIRLSPQHAKAVAMILIQQLKLYEDTIGAIPLPSQT